MFEGTVEERTYNLKHLIDDAQNIVDRISETETLDKAGFERTANDVVTLLLALVEIDDDTPDNNFIDFVEAYIYEIE